ncbi:copper oxidase, partial [Nocardioides sp. DS6]
RPLRAKVGQRVRIWVLDAGPNRPTAFHVVGGQFDTVFAEGAYLLRRNNPAHGAAQVLSLGPAQGGFVEMSFREPGHYPFVSHLMVDAERGAHGTIAVTR